MGNAIGGCVWLQASCLLPGTGCDHPDPMTLPNPTRVREPPNAARILRPSSACMIYQTSAVCVRSSGAGT